MRRLMVAGNWKMHGTVASVNDLTQAIIANTNTISDVDILLLPPFVFLQQVKQILGNSQVVLGAQNVAIAESGAYTGEVAADMLKDVGCQYVLVGHSERRALYGETNDIVKDKFIRAKSSGLTPILCVGETLAEREQGLTHEIIEKQINSVLELENAAELLYNGVIAYEPVWAIGTGVSASPEQAQEVHALIRNRLRSMLASQSNQLADTIRILYGGSVKAANAAKLFDMPDIDGGLVGGASLNAQEFLEICQCNKSY